MQKGEKGEGGETERLKKKVGRGSVREYDGGHRRRQGGSGNGERIEALYGVYGGHSGGE